MKEKDCICCLKFDVCVIRYDIVRSQTIKLTGISQVEIDSMIAKKCQSYEQRKKEKGKK